MTETGTWTAAEGKLAGRIDQLIGWAKANKTREYYWLAIENADRLRDDILAVVAELGGLAADATDGESFTEWAVAYGCPSGDPNESAGILPYDDEADAQENLQWIKGSILARRTVTTSRWKRAHDAEGSDAQ
jgi:hypothetical protein